MQHLRIPVLFLDLIPASKMARGTWHLLSHDYCITQKARSLYSVNSR